MAKNHIIPVFIPHAGCPHNCVFCDQHAISGTPVTPAPQRIVDRIQCDLARIAGPAELAFYGGSFTCLPLGLQEDYLSSVAFLLKEGSISRIRVSTRPDAITPAVTDLLKRYGVETVELGCQSLDDGVLALAERGHTEQDIVNAVQQLKKAGFRVIMQLMFGLPGDTPPTAEQTCRKAVALHPDGVRFYPVVVIQNTPLQKLMTEGRYTPLSVADAVNLCADLLPLFVKADIPVIRLGLNPTDDLSGGIAVGGAYHPALGELTWSRYFYNLASEKLSAVRPLPPEITLMVHASKLSVMAGQHRQNITALCRRFDLRRIHILPGNPDPYGVALQLQQKITESVSQNETVFLSPFRP